MYVNNIIIDNNLYVIVNVFVCCFTCMTYVFNLIVLCIVYYLGMCIVYMICAHYN